MTQKEKYMQVKSMEEFKKRKNEFVGLDFSDEDVKKHLDELVHIPRERLAVTKDGYQIH